MSVATGGSTVSASSGSSLSSIGSAVDSAVSTPQEGDVLRYSSGKWRNYADANLTDGGNF